MKNTIGPFTENVLDDIHSKLLEFPMLFRDKVNEECSWSTPTFYRKRKDPAGISNAEREKIVGILDDEFRSLRVF